MLPAKLLLLLLTLDISALTEGMREKLRVVDGDDWID